jgi:hypothetical protein
LSRKKVTKKDKDKDKDKIDDNYNNNNADKSNRANIIKNVNITDRKNKKISNSIKKDNNLTSERNNDKLIIKINLASGTYFLILFNLILFNYYSYFI